eukprot:TRINITY_DN67512_c3_g9_i2.p1 TRINITY_DN67512_c3_g9~~TRINITY_DN67512_c3_g9_i2.p1  ORF type:complete len:155 (-),score=12.95 TRINITY_DN67512_c3_g9_i2:216-680(-)
MNVMPTNMPGAFVGLLVITQNTTSTAAQTRQHHSGRVLSWSQKKLHHCVGFALRHLKKMNLKNVAFAGKFLKRINDNATPEDALKYAQYQTLSRKEKSKLKKHKPAEPACLLPSLPIAPVHLPTNRKRNTKSSPNETGNLTELIKYAKSLHNQK